MRLLIELAGKLSLVELQFEMRRDIDANYIAILISFLHLKVLSIVDEFNRFNRVPYATIFPPMLKQLELE